MYKLVLEPFYSGKHGRSALFLLKNLQIARTSFSRRSNSKWWNDSRHVNEEEERKPEEPQYSSESNSNKERKYKENPRHFTSETSGDCKNEQSYSYRTKLRNSLSNDKKAVSRHKQSYGKSLSNYYKSDGSERITPSYINEEGERFYQQSDYNDVAMTEGNAVFDKNEAILEAAKYFQEMSEYDVTSKDSVKKSKKKKLPKNWADKFGTLAPQEEHQSYNEAQEVDLEDDLREQKIHQHIRLSTKNRAHIPHWYARQIMKYGKQGKVRKAIEVFERWMIEQDRVKPTSNEYLVLMMLLSNVGYVDKVFELYKRMCQRGLPAHGKHYSCMFNACANSPWPEYGLQSAKRLREIMLCKNIKPHYKTYLAMIKAFGFCGDIDTAFQVADEAATIHVDEHLMSNMLTACISDKEAGFRHAVMVWRKCRTMGIKPSLISYNLLFRCVEECGVGDPKLVKKMFNQPTISIADSEQMLKHDYNLTEKEMFIDVNKQVEHTEINSSDKIEIQNQIKQRKQRVAKLTFKEIDELMAKYCDENTETNSQLEGDSSDSNLEIAGQNVIDITSELDSDSVAIDTRRTSDIDKVTQWWEQDIFTNSVSNLPVHRTETTMSELSNQNFPDILNPKEDLTYLVDVSAIKTKHDRLDLLGGLHGVLNTLKARNIQPSVVTFTLLAKSVRVDSLDFLINKMWASGHPPDVIFYNSCMLEYAYAHPRTAWALYDQMKAEDLTPDAKTFSILALACKNETKGMQLLDDMMAADIMPNTYTFSALLKAAFYHHYYKIKLLKKMEELDVQCNKHIVELIEKSIQMYRMKLLQQERDISLGGSEEDMKKLQIKEQGLDHFVSFYEKWLKRQNLAVEPHPWKSFQPEKVEQR